MYDYKEIYNASFRIMGTRLALFSSNHVYYHVFNNGSLSAGSGTIGPGIGFQIVTEVEEVNLHVIY